ncbi:DUF1064 domain-containing protein [Halalkalibacter urbisdiaboli]|uniref:DUF1064 domain-containing protein n=1 Tax=Halalkalibacter urbisdiaboli TaxID=1960589 RepID=UPI000B44B23C|nr:DUF1064 domain-containing protein [Halalkalibacter urbisdiaboli]
MGKINSNKVEMFGRVWDSQTELEYYLFLHEQSNIKEIELQPQFTLLKPFLVTCLACVGIGQVPSLRTGKPIKCRRCNGQGRKERQKWSYKADFRVTYTDGRVEVIDVKGWANERFPLTKRMYEYVSGTELVVVKKTKTGWKRG